MPWEKQGAISASIVIVGLSARVSLFSLSVNENRYTCLVTLV